MCICIYIGAAASQELRGAAHVPAPDLPVAQGRQREPPQQVRARPAPHQVLRGQYNYVHRICYTVQLYYTVYIVIPHNISLSYTVMQYSYTIQP
jgi:hypothetical protein